MSEGIKVQYQILITLKRTEEKIARLQAEAARIPEEITTLERALAEKRVEYQKSKDLHDAQEKALRKAESDLKEKEDFLHKAEGKMMEVKTNEEYQAAMKENSGHKSEKQVLEEKILLLMNQMEEVRKTLKEAEKKYKDFETTLNQDKKKLEDERMKTLRNLEEQLSQRAQNSAGLEPAVAALYQRTLDRYRGVPIVVAENGMCVGCNMKVRPQLFNEILGRKAIHQCPACSRILITLDQDPSAEE